MAFFFFFFLLFAPMEEYGKKCSQDLEGSMMTPIKSMCKRNVCDTIMPCWGALRFVWRCHSGAYESETWLSISLALAPRCWKMILAAMNLPLCSWAKCSLDGCNQKSNSVREKEFCKNKQIKTCRVEFLIMHCEHDKH